MATTTKTPAAKTAKAPKATKPATVKAAAKPSTNGKPAATKPVAKSERKAGGLRKPQVRILTCLAKAKQPLSRKEISEKASVDLAFCTEYLGSNDEAKRAHNDTKPGGFPSLVTLKLVKFGQPNTETSASVYEITAAGRKALEQSAV